MQLDSFRFFFIQCKTDHHHHDHLISMYDAIYMRNETSNKTKRNKTNNNTYNDNKIKN